MRGQTGVLLRLEDAARWPYWMLCQVDPHRSLDVLDRLVATVPIGQASLDERLSRDGVIEWVRCDLGVTRVWLQPLADAECPSWWVHETSPVDPDATLRRGDTYEPGG